MAEILEANIDVGVPIQHARPHRHLKLGRYRWD